MSEYRCENCQSVMNMGGTCPDCVHDEREGHECLCESCIESFNEELEVLRRDLVQLATDNPAGVMEVTRGHRLLLTAAIQGKLLDNGGSADDAIDFIVKCATAHKAVKGENENRKRKRGVS